MFKVNNGLINIAIVKSLYKFLLKY